jgi:predicted Zn-dependent protease
MKKFWSGFRNEADKNAREDRDRVRAAQLKQLRHLLEIGGHEAEPEYCQLLKDWKPQMSKEELADRIRLYHAAVSARQSRDQGSR